MFNTFKLLFKAMKLIWTSKECSIGNTHGFSSLAKVDSRSAHINKGIIKLGLIEGVSETTDQIISEGKNDGHR
jgi:hypothetical protein